MSRPGRSTPRLGALEIEQLAKFRYAIRRFLRFSENAAREAGVTPQQHQLMLGIAGFSGRGWANISELAEFLQERHNAVVELVDRAARSGLVRRQAIASDRRVVRVELTARGRSILMRLSALHREELARIRDNRQLNLLPGPRARAGGKSNSKNASSRRTDDLAWHL